MIFLKNTKLTKLFNFELIYVLHEILMFTTKKKSPSLCNQYSQMQMSHSETTI